MDYLQQHTKDENEKDQIMVESDKGASKWRKLKENILLNSKNNNFNIDFSMWNVLKEAMLKRKGLIEIGPRQPENYEFTSKF